MSSRNFGLGPAAGQYSAEDDNQLQPEDTLIDRGIDDVLDEGFSPPEQPFGHGAFAPSESIEQQLAEEEQDPRSRSITRRMNSSGPTSRAWIEFPQRSEVGRVRAGRLVAPDRGFGEDIEAELVAEDVGISGEQRLPKRPLFTSSTTGSSSLLAPRSDVNRAGRSFSSALGGHTFCPPRSENLDCTVNIPIKQRLSISPTDAASPRFGGLGKSALYNR